MVALLWAAAARAEEQFEDAETFLGRPITGAVSFGFGALYCVGADLGRLRLAVAVGEFLAAFADFSLDGDVVRTIWPTQGIRAIPVRAR